MKKGSKFLSYSALLILIMLVIIIKFVLGSYFNFCVMKMSFVTEQMKIEAAVEYLLNHYAPIIERREMREDGAGINRSVQNNFEKLALYQSVEDFMQQNPHCCVLFREKTGRYFFNFGDAVEITYHIKYIENNKEKIDTAYGLLNVDSCGNVWPIGR